MPETLRIAVGQLNFWVGDISGNAEKILNAANKARDELKADLIVFPELALSGYPSEDLLLRPDFQHQIDKALIYLQKKISGIDVILGHPQTVDKKIYNSASLIRDHKIILTYHKQCLPNYGVFDEKRYFSKGENTTIFEIKNTSVALLICEDIWHSAPVEQAALKGAQLIISINASPLDMHKPHVREKVSANRIKEHGIPILYVHGVSGQDDLVFDGGSFIMDSEGKIKAHAGYFEEKIFPIDINLNKTLEIPQTNLPKPLSLEAHVYEALKLSLHDYVKKNNFPGVIIGLSGGIDSSLTAAIAVDALGKDKVHLIVMPSRYTSSLSLKLAEEQIKMLGAHTSNISIEPVFQTFLETLAPEFTGLPANITEENLQARCRGMILMALSNKTGKMVLTTGNKSEIAVGYATLYGDMAGGFAILKDVPKTLVFRLANYRNGIDPIIPQGIIDRPPTAELATNQKDEDSLPPYSILDPILELYVEQDKSPQEIIAAGFDVNTVRKIINLVDHSEYKRRQAAPGPRITLRAFGRERRYPITSSYRFEIFKD